MKNNKSKIKCLECGKLFSSIGYHIKKHDLTSQEYLIRHPNAQLSADDVVNKIKEKSVERYKSAEFRKKVGKRTFDFIKNKDLKSLLQRDYKSAKTCLENELWKPSIVLYGSIIEAILIEINPKAKTFSDALELAKENSQISEKEYHKIHMVRNLRNYVHLHEELEEQGDINEYWARTFADICEKIIKRFGM